MDKSQKIAALAALISSSPDKAEFAASLMGALVKGNPTPKQSEWIDRLINEAQNPLPSLNLHGLVESFRLAALTVKFPKVVMSVGEQEVTLSYTRPDSEKAKPENKDTVSVASGKWGDPAAKWYGRIGADGVFKPGKDATPAVAEALAALDPNALPWKKR